MSKRTLLLQRTLKPIAGGIFGLFLGSIAGLPIASAFAPATVIWHAANCPAGVYTITSVARHLDTGQTFQVRSASVTLPQPSVVQNFTSLPAGVYEVRGTAVSTDGESLGPSIQSLTVFDTAVSGTFRTGKGARTPPPPPTPGRRGHNSPAPVTGADSRGKSAASVSATVAVPPADSTRAVTARGSARAALLARLDELTALFGDDPAVRRIEVADDDGDGRLDAIVIEWLNGEIRSWQITRGR